MAPRTSRHQALLRLPTPKRIFDVDGFLEDRVSEAMARSPLIRLLSTGQRKVDRRGPGCDMLEVHFWEDSESKVPHRTEVVCIPDRWSGKMYLAAFLMTYSSHECICIQTERVACGLVSSPFRSISVVSSFFLSEKKDLEVWLRVQLQTVEGGQSI